MTASQFKENVKIRWGGWSPADFKCRKLEFYRVGFNTEIGSGKIVPPYIDTLSE